MKLDLIPFPGGTLPAITDADIGKSLVVGTEPTTVFIIPEQTVNAEGLDEAYYNPTNVDKSAFIVGASVTLYWDGDNIGTATVQHNNNLNYDYAEFVTDEDAVIRVRTVSAGMRITISTVEGVTPDSAVISMTGTGEKAVWSVGSIVEKLEIDWDEGEFADTWQEVKNKLNSGKFLYAISSYDSPTVWIVASAYVNGTSYEVDMINLEQLTGDTGHYLWITDSADGHPINDD